METKIVNIGDREFKIKELSLDDSLVLSGIKDPQESTKKILQIAVDPPLSDEDRKSLSMRDGLKLIEEINNLNGLGKDFFTTKTPNTNDGK